MDINEIKKILELLQIHIEEKEKAINNYRLTIQELEEKTKELKDNSLTFKTIAYYMDNTNGFDKRIEILVSVMLFDGKKISKVIRLGENIIVNGILIQPYNGGDQDYPRGLPNNINSTFSYKGKNCYLYVPR